MKFIYGEVIKKVEILDMTVEGKCVAKPEGRVVFVTGVAPGDIVDVKVFGRDKKFLEAEPVFFHKYSQMRTQPVCKHFGTCGGCKWQHIQYESQLFFKEKQVKDALERIAKVPFPDIKPIIGSEQTLFYRNKLEFTFSNKRWFEKKNENNEDANALGFHIPGRFDKILDIETCYLQTELINTIRNGLKQFALDNKLTFFDVKLQNGLLRNVMFRTGSNEQLMVMVQFFENNSSQIELVLEYLKTSFPQITSLMYVVNSKRNDTFHDLEVIRYHGNDHIIEQMHELKFKIGPKSFFQTNSKQALLLYEKAIALAELSKEQVLYDLYTGTGTIALFAAKYVKKVVGIEYVPMAVEDAIINSKANNILNSSFFSGDMAKILNADFVNKNGKPDVIITDPPRAGMHDDVIKMLLQIKAKTIVYVSCNPATQARDLSLLHPVYKITEAQPVDMFPQTAHVENIVKLELANS